MDHICSKLEYGVLCAPSRRLTSLLLAHSLQTVQGTLFGLWTAEEPKSKVDWEGKSAERERGRLHSLRCGRANSGERGLLGVVKRVQRHHTQVRPTLVR